MARDGNLDNKDAYRVVIHRDNMDKCYGPYVSTGAAKTQAKNDQNSGWTKTNYPATVQKLTAVLDDEGNPSLEWMDVAKMTNFIWINV